MASRANLHYHCRGRHKLKVPDTFKESILGQNRKNERKKKRKATGQDNNELDNREFTVQDLMFVYSIHRYKKISYRLWPVS